MSDDARVPCGRLVRIANSFWGGRCNKWRPCGNCTALLTIRRRVAELEATAARRLELLRPIATAYDAWVAADSDTAIEITPEQGRAAAAEVAKDSP